MVTLTQQLACARRELSLRKAYSAKWVSSGRMSKESAAHEIEAMAAIVETLEKLRIYVLKGKNNVD